MNEILRHQRHVSYRIGAQKSEKLFPLPPHLADTDRLLDRVSVLASGQRYDVTHGAGALGGQNRGAD